MTLVETAKATPRTRRPKRKLRKDSPLTRDMVDMSLLWAHDALSYGQCSTATRLKGGSLYSRLAWGLRVAVRNGRLRESTSGPENAYSRAASAAFEAAFKAAHEAARIAYSKALEGENEYGTRTTN